MKRKSTLALFFVLGTYVAAGNLIGCLAFIFGVDSGDTLFLIFYPCTVFWAVAYFVGPTWMIFGCGIAIGQLWLVYKSADWYLAERKAA